MSRADVGSAILGQLAEAKIVFNLDRGSGKNPVFEKCMEGINVYLANDRWPNVPDAYKNNQTLVAAVTALRQARGLSTDAPVL